MSRHILALLGIFLLMPLAECLEPESFRAMYDQPWNRPADRFWSYTLLRDLGFDAVYAPADAVGDLNGSLSRWRNGSLEAEENGLQYICGPFYMVGRPACDYEHAVDAGGHRDRKRPSPVDEGYWTLVMEDVAIAIANLSLHSPVDGAVWDTEHYGSDIWEYGFYSYDSYAMAAFANETDTEIPDLPASERHGWLRSRGLLDEFQLWQEDAVYRLARRTRDRVRAINPDLHLGTLGFEDDCWFHLAILKGFSAEESPVTAWHEDTYYGGYKTGKIDANHEVFRELGINGKVIPGLWTYDLTPFHLLRNMAFAMRYNGTFWIYQSGGKPWELGTRDEFLLAFEMLQGEVLFDGSDREFVPEFEIYPGVLVRTVVGPAGSSMFLLPRTNEPGSQYLELPASFIGSTLLGTNMTASNIRSTSLPFAELPCFIYGLDPGDPTGLEAWSKIQELRYLLDLWEPMALGPMPGVREALQDATLEFESGRVEAVNISASRTLSEAYDLALEALWPYVERGFRNPRNSSVPMTILNKINNAARAIEDRRVIEGRNYLLHALREWQRIPELTAVPSICAFLACTMISIRLFSAGRAQSGNRTGPSEILIRPDRVPGARCPRKRRWRTRAESQPA